MKYDFFIIFIISLLCIGVIFGFSTLYAIPFSDFKVTVLGIFIITLVVKIGVMLYRIDQIVSYYYNELRKVEKI